MGKAKDNARQSGCTVAYCLDLFGDRWSLIVVRDMVLQAKRYFGEFLESPERIASNILADRLKRLEEVGVVTKNEDPENQKKFIYSLTPKGLDLIPLILDMFVWAAKHSDFPKQAKQMARRFETDRDTVINEIIVSIKENRPYVIPPPGKEKQ